MFICLQVQAPDHCTIDYLLGARWKQRDFLLSEGRTVLGSLQILLSDSGCSVTDISGVAVVVGAGRFTATRVATTIANTLAFAFRIPVVAVAAGTPLPEIPALLAAQPVGQYATPVYSAPAHIGGRASSLC